MITLISSTNRANCQTLKLTQFYQNILEQKGMASEIINLQNLPDNILGTDLYGARSEAFIPFQNAITQGKKFIFFIPEYNGSFPGVLKLFVDCLSFPESFFGKRVALVGLSAGTYGNIRGIDHFTGVCHYLGLHVMPGKIHIPFIKKELIGLEKKEENSSLKFIHQQIDEFLLF